MSLSDHEVARAVVDSETTKISYEWFDRLLGLDNPGDSTNHSQRYLVMKRVNTILEKGMQHGETYGAYQLEVGEREQFYERKTLAESASLSIHAATEKATKAIDRAAQLSAYALGEKQYFRITDRKFSAIRKQAPQLTDSELSELRVEYRMLRQNQSILLAMLSNAENNIENIERLMGGASSRNRRMLPRNEGHQGQQAA